MAPIDTKEWPEWARIALKQHNFEQTAIQMVKDRDEKIFELETQPSGCLQAFTNWIDGWFGSK